jgi:nucleoside-diphosphate-sugar epimerase
MMRILVTGARGFIGAHVVRALGGRGHIVIAAVRNKKMVETQESQLGDVHFVELDLNDDAGVRSAIHQIRPDVAIHLAWYTVPGKYWTAPVNLDCVSATLRFARVLAEAGCRRLLVTGSCAEYDWDHGFLSEECTPLRPRTLYGACKNALREILEMYCVEASMQFVWTRLFYLYGSGEAAERFVPSIILPLLQGQTAKCTSGEQIRDFLHVEDVAEAIVAVAASDFTGTVNIGSGQPVKIKTIVEAIAEILDCRERVVVGGIPDSPSEPPVLLADVRRLTRDVGWRPSHTLDEGLLLTVDWWRANS